MNHIAEVINNVLDVEWVDEIVTDTEKSTDVTNYANTFFTSYCVELV